MRNLSMNTAMDLMMSNEVQRVLEAVKKPGPPKPPKRFRQRVVRKTIKTQRSVFQGQTAARIAKQRNAGLSRRKAYYRKMYLDMKAREQKMYGNAAKAQSYRR